MKKIVFGLNSVLVAEAPADMTVKQLIEQVKQIQYNRYDEGLCCLGEDFDCNDYDEEDLDVVFNYNDVRFANGNRTHCGIAIKGEIK